MSSVSLHRRPHLAGLASREPTLHERASAALHQSLLDRRLASGAETADDRALTVRAWQITRLPSRRRLAASIVAVVEEADHPHRGRGSIGLCTEEVHVAKTELLRLAARLIDPQPTRPRGVALVRQLLTDGAGPLYSPCGNDELWRRARAANDALD